MTDDRSTDNRNNRSIGSCIKDIKRYKLIACEILHREACLCAAGCRNIIDIVFMEKGLHDIGAAKMREKLQAEINDTDINRYEAILLCYGICNNGVCGLRSELPLVIPRAHDCITLLLGSKERYTDYFNNNPGTYFKSPGWCERDGSSANTEGHIMTQLGLNNTYSEYVELYGEENAEYIMEILGDWTKNYKKMTFIDTKTGLTELYAEESKRIANEHNWEYEELEGNTRLIYKLLNGDWDDDEFLVVPPNNAICATNEENVVAAVKEDTNGGCF